MKKKKIMKRIGIGILVVIAAFLLIGVIWINHTYKPDDIAKEALKGDETVKVIKDKYITFKPVNETKKGFIFYPGGLVEPEAYAPLCKAIAKEGYLVVITPMKLNLAILSNDRANEVIKRYPEIKEWSIGGHSLGGVMACKYAAGDERIKGIVLYAAYPQGNEIEDSKASVLSIYGSEDGVAKLDKIKQSALPDTAKIVEIPNGNHCYFGNYGMQKGDNKTTLTREEQQKEAVKATVDLLDHLK